MTRRLEGGAAERRLEGGADYGPERRLVAAVLLLAVQDARGGGSGAAEAGEFLELCGADLAELALDIEPGRFARWQSGPLVRSWVDPERVKAQGRARGARYRKRREERRNMASSITREEAERRLAELRDEERKLREAEAAAAAAEENERRELLTAIERAKQAERAEHLAAAQTHFVAVHQELVERLVDLAPACAAWEAARRGAMGSAGISGDEVGPVREIVASMGKLTRARENAPHMAAQRETQRRDDLRVAKLAEKKAAATAEARRELGW